MQQINLQMTLYLLYALDISVVLLCSNRNELQQQLKDVLNNISEWLQNRNYDKSVSKTKVMQFKSQKKSI